MDSSEIIDGLSSFFCIVGSVVTGILACRAGGLDYESLCDDTTDNTNVVADTLEEEDDDNESKHLYGVVVK